MKEKMKRVSDIIPQAEMLEGEQMQKTELVNKELILKNAVEVSSTYEGRDTFFVVQGELEGKLITFSGGSIIDKKIKQLKEKQAFPIKAKITKNTSKSGRTYYDLV